MKRSVLMLMVAVVCVPTLVEAVIWSDTPSADVFVLVDNPSNFNDDGRLYCTSWQGSYAFITLVQWDLPVDLPGKIVNSASVTFDINPHPDTIVNGDTVYLVPMVQSWTETGATWFTSDGSTPWTGGEPGDATDWTHAPGGGGSHGWDVVYDGDATTTYDVTPMVQDWADGSANYGLGWLMVSTDGQIVSYPREDANGGGVLTIDYVPEPATMMLLGLGGLLIRRRR